MFDEFDEMFEEDHDDCFQSLLLERNEAVILDEVVHESAVVELVCEDFLIYYVETV
jgi:hypothetical protein